MTKKQKSLTRVGLTRKDDIGNADIRGTLKVDRFGENVRQSSVKWRHGHMNCRDDDNVGRNVLEMHLPGKVNGEDHTLAGVSSKASLLPTPA